MSFPDEREPPRHVWYSLEEALQAQVRELSHRLEFDGPGETQMAEPLRATEAARRLGIPPKDLLRLINDRQIHFVMVDGIAHVPADAIDEYPGRAAS